MRSLRRILFLENARFDRQWLEAFLKRSNLVLSNQISLSLEKRKANEIKLPSNENYTDHNSQRR